MGGKVDVKEIISIIFVLLIMGTTGLWVYWQIYKRTGFEWIIIIFLFLCVVYLINKIEELKTTIKKLEK
jgi:hypothetical protein